MQTVTELPPRHNISHSVVEVVRNLIVDGQLPPGQRLNEVHLAQSLGVSRTPLREALGRLAAEGALDSVARIGYFVRPLTLDEFEQIYAIRPILDPEALRMAGLPSARQIKRLKTLNDDILAADDADTVIALDDTWHRELIAGCANKVLIELIDQNIRRTRRYELGLMRERKNVQVATENHKQILTALRAKDLDAACDALRRNLQSGFAPIAAWLAARDSDITQT